MSETSRRRWRWWLVLAAVVLAAGLARGLYWLFKPGPTEIRLVLAGWRVAFIPGGDRPHEILNASVGFSELDVEGFAELAFSARRLEAYPNLSSVAADEILPLPDPAWVIEPAGDVALACRRKPDGRCDEIPRVTLRTTDPAFRNLGRLYGFEVPPGAEVVLTTSPRQAESGRLSRIRMNVEPAGPVRLRAEGELVLVSESVELARPEGAGIETDYMTYRAEPPDTWLALELTHPEERRLELVVTPSSMDDAESFFAAAARLPLETVNLFGGEAAGGLPVPASCSGGELSYPGTRKEPLRFEKEELVVLGELESVLLERLALDAGGGCFDLRFVGTAGRIEIAGKDRRLTGLEKTRYGAPWAALELWALVLGIAGSILGLAWRWLARGGAGGDGSSGKRPAMPETTSEPAAEVGVARNPETAAAGRAEDRRVEASNRRTGAARQGSEDSEPGEAS